MLSAMGPLLQVLHSFLQEYHPFYFLSSSDQQFLLLPLHRVKVFLFLICSCLLHKKVMSFRYLGTMNLNFFAIFLLKSIGTISYIIILLFQLENLLNIIVTIDMHHIIAFELLSMQREGHSYCCPKCIHACLAATYLHPLDLIDTAILLNVTALQGFPTRGARHHSKGSTSILMKGT